MSQQQQRKGILKKAQTMSSSKHNAVKFQDEGQSGTKTAAWDAYDPILRSSYYDDLNRNYANSISTDAPSMSNLLAQGSKSSTRPMLFAQSKGPQVTTQDRVTDISHRIEPRHVLDYKSMTKTYDESFEPSTYSLSSYRNLY
jgi:hypothetical protein